jgi:putative ABC transport system permease protein
LWSITGIAENALFIIASFVLAVGLIGMLTSLLSNLEGRRREMAILRSVGARPGHIIGLLVGEAFFLTVLGVVVGLALLYGLLWATSSLLEHEFGLYIKLIGPSGVEFGILAAVIVMGTAIGLIPGYRVYRYTLVDGMTVRL